MVCPMEFESQHPKDLMKNLESDSEIRGLAHCPGRIGIGRKGLFVIAAATVMMACLGGIYAWSLLVARLQAEGGFSALETQLVFGTVVLVLCASTLVAGPLQQKAGPRIVSVLGGLLYGGGYLLAANAGSSFLCLWLGAGLLVGLGTGAGYISAIATAIRWLPGRKGLATGIVVGGYGSGAIFSKMLFQSLIGQGWQVESIFLTLALGYGGAIILTALCLRLPAHTAFADPVPGGGDGSAAVVRGSDLLRDRRCWRMFFALLFGNIPGLMIIGSFAPIAGELGHSSSLAGIGISALAIGNCAGRVGWGALFDRIGGGKSVGLSLITIVVSVLLVFSARAAVPVGGLLLLLAALTVGLGFASCLVLHAAESAKLFGPAGMSAAYPLIFQAHGLGALIGSALGGYACDATGSYQLALWLALASGIVALALYLGLGSWPRNGRLDG